MTARKAASTAMALLIAVALAGCASGSGETSQPTPPASTPAETPASTPAETTAESAGCPATVFEVFASLSNIAEASDQAGAIADAIGVKLPSEPACTITWTDDAGEPSFTMWWPGNGATTTAADIRTAIEEAGFTGKTAGPGQKVYSKGKVTELHVGAYDPDSKLGTAVGAPTAVLYGTDPR